MCVCLHVAFFYTSVAQWFSNFSKHQNRLEWWLKQTSGPTLGASDPVDLWWGLENYICNKSLGDVDAAGPGNHILRAITSPP